MSAHVSTIAPAGARPRSRPRPKAVAFLALTKPRIVQLLLVTTVPTMILAAHGLPSGWLMVSTLAGGALAAGGANAMNMVADADIDRVMSRTAGRPLVTGEVAPGAALVFAVALEAAAFVVLVVFVNLLAAYLALAATAFYIFVYTLWLKRTSSHSIVIGGAAGAVPVLVGWAAVTGHLALAPLLLFAVIFVWTPPHFWALAIRYADDYEAAGVPMLPVVASVARTARAIVGYTLAVWALSLVFAAVARMGLLYWPVATASGGVFLLHAERLRREASVARAVRLFRWSINYVMLLFGAIAADVLLRRALG